MVAKEFSFTQEKSENIKFKRAIIVVDNDVDSELLINCLRPIHYRILGKTKVVSQGLEMVRKYKSGLLFLDFDIAVLESMAILEKLRLNSRDIRVIVLAKKLEKSQVADAKKQGVVGFLAKPVNVTAVKKILGKCL